MDGFLAHIPCREGNVRSARLLRLHGAGRGREKKKPTVRGGARAEEKGATATPSPDWKVN